MGKYTRFNDVEITGKLKLGGAAEGKLAGTVVLSGAADPTNATVGVVGQLYRQTTDGGIFMCTAVSGTTYTWKEITFVT